MTGERLRFLAPGVALLLSTPVLAQEPAELVRERAEYDRWLRTSVVSPLKAVAHVLLRAGVSIGPPDAEVPLPGVTPSRIVPFKKAWVLESSGEKRFLARDRPIALQGYTLYLTEGGTGTVLTAYGGRVARPPGYYPYDPSLVFIGSLSPPPPDSAGSVRVLDLEGVEREATRAGSVLVAMGGGTTRLQVLRIPGSGEGESELEIFFRDETNGRGSYPAGRFVSLEQLDRGRYRLDFNRARNPFCAYSPAYACPAPWRGNRLSTSVQAGERYDGGPVTQ